MFCKVKNVCGTVTKRVFVFGVGFLLQGGLNWKRGLFECFELVCFEGLDWGGFGDGLKGAVGFLDGRMLKR